MQINRRHEGRQRFCMEYCRGSFILEALDEEYEIEVVTDVSLSGMGFELSSYLDPETPVTIEYEDDEYHIALSGTVSWCEDTSCTEGNYQLGINFDYTSRDESSQLLLALRDYFAGEAPILAP